MRGLAGERPDLRFERRLPAVDGAIAPARAALERWLASLPLDDAAAGELLVVFSELAANAVTATAAGSHVDVVADVEGDDVVLEVRNGAVRTESLRAQWDLDDPLRAGGRGLVLVRAFTDEVAFEAGRDGRGMVVRCRRRLAGR